MMELFIADALNGKSENEVKIFTLIMKESSEELINRLSKNDKDSITILWEILSSKSTSYIKKSIEFAKVYKEKCRSPLLIGGYWASTVSDHFKEFDIFDHIIYGYSIDSIAQAIKNWEITRTKRIIYAKGQAKWNKYIDYFYNISKASLLNEYEYFYVLPFNKIEFHLEIHK
ncbi:MAG: hypothetical protein JW822_01330 [Spirochaetales bacterium]|nr:hypothetical protein [Spirochaetales bacterium]